MSHPHGAQGVLYSESIRNMKAKSEWLIWFGATGGALLALALLYGAFGAPPAWRDYITWVIVVLFLATLGRSFRDVTFLDRETRLASEQVEQLAQINDIASFLQVARPSVFRSHIAALHTIFLADPQIAQDSLIEITHARLTARNKTVELLASILITLGLIGTIVGLLLSIGGLQEVLGSKQSDADSMRMGMRSTMAGMSTAFYTTLVGAAFGGVILRILTSVVDANILRYMAHLAELTEVYVLPAMRRMASRLDVAGYYRQLDDRGSTSAPHAAG